MRHSKRYLVCKRSVVKKVVLSNAKFFWCVTKNHTLIFASEVFNMLRVFRDVLWLLSFHLVWFEIRFCNVALKTI